MIIKLENINGKLVNLLVGCLGVILILLTFIDCVVDPLKAILLSIGTSILATSIVTALNAKYLVSQSNATAMTEKWGLEGIYTVRANINTHTNKALARANQLDVCAMGLKGFRDAQGKNIANRVSKGMRIRILTLSPNSPFLSEIDRNEGLAEGSTKASIESLLKWISELQKIQLSPGQVEVKTYNTYPHEFYFCIDGTIYIGPYENKTSQQTITYRFNPYGQGARYYSNYFENLWKG